MQEPLKYIKQICDSLNKAIPNSTLTNCSKAIDDIKGYMFETKFVDNHDYGPIDNVVTCIGYEKTILEFSDDKAFYIKMCNLHEALKDLKEFLNEYQSKY